MLFNNNFIYFVIRKIFRYKIKSSKKFSGFFLRLILFYFTFTDGKKNPTIDSSINSKRILCSSQIQRVYYKGLFTLELTAEIVFENIGNRDKKFKIIPE